MLDNATKICDHLRVLSRMPTLYPIRAVSKLTGIPVDTLRAWERRYQVVVPDRSTRGRLYADTDILRLRLLKDCLERGHSIGQIAALPDAKLQVLASTSIPVREVQNEGSVLKTGAPELRPLFDALEAFDESKINGELSRLALLLSPSDLVYQVILPVMKLAGENWENGGFGIALGHIFSACVRSLLGGLIRLHRPASGAAKLLFTTPANEMHEFGILSAALLAMAQEFPVSYLGPNLPAREILSAAERSGAKVVVLGIMQMNATPSACREIGLIASGLPVTTELWIGGSGAITASRGVIRKKLFILQDLPDFERQLLRLKTDQSR